MLLETEAITNDHLKSNITKYYLFQFFYALSFAFVPFFVLFMRERGLSYTEIGITSAVYYIGFLFFEMPTGIAADKLGRKKTILITTLLKAVGIIVSYYSFSLWPFIFSEILLSLARAMGSGATSAFLYDSLLHMKQESQFKIYAGRSHGMHLTGNAIAGVLGFFLLIYGYNLDALYAVSAISAIIAFFTALTFIEPLAVETIDPIKKTLKAYGLHFIDAVKDVKASSHIMWLIAYSSFIFLLSRTIMISLQQPLLIDLTIENHYFGIVDAIIALGAVFLSRSAYRVEKRLGFNNILIFFPSVIVVILVGMGITSSYTALVFLFMLMIIHGVYPPVIRHYVNDTIQDSFKRATILSIESLVARVSYGLYALPIGYILDVYGFHMAALVTAAIAIIGTMGLLIAKIYAKKLDF